MAKFVVNAYRVREVLISTAAGTGFLIENGPDGSDDVMVGDYVDVEVGDYWVNPFGDGHIVKRAVFEQTYTPMDDDVTILREGLAPPCN